MHSITWFHDQQQTTKHTFQTHMSMMTRFASSRQAAQPSSHWQLPAAEPVLITFDVAAMCWCPSAVSQVVYSTQQGSSLRPRCCSECRDGSPHLGIAHDGAKGCPGSTAGVLGQAVAHILLAGIGCYGGAAAAIYCFEVACAVDT